eukprot:2267850-Rhodomonas_salina.1
MEATLTHKQPLMEATLTQREPRGAVSKATLRWEFLLPWVVTRRGGLQVPASPHPRKHCQTTLEQ